MENEDLSCGEHSIIRFMVCQVVSFILFKFPFCRGGGSFAEKTPLLVPCGVICEFGRAGVLKKIVQGTEKILNLYLTTDKYGCIIAEIMMG